MSTSSGSDPQGTATFSIASCKTNPLLQILQVEVEWLSEEENSWVSALNNRQYHLKQLSWGGY